MSTSLSFLAKILTVLFNIKLQADELAYYMHFLKGGKPSGKEVSERKSKLQSDLLAGFVQEEGQEVSQRNVMSYLALGEDCAVLLTRAIKRTFPLATTRRNREDGTYPFLCTFDMNSQSNVYDSFTILHTNLEYMYM